MEEELNRKRNGKKVSNIFYLLLENLGYNEIFLYNNKFLI